MEKFIPVTYKLYKVYAVLQTVLSAALQTDGENHLTEKITSVGVYLIKLFEGEANLRWREQFNHHLL